MTTGGGRQPRGDFASFLKENRRRNHHKRKEAVKLLYQFSIRIEKEMTAVGGRQPREDFVGMQPRDEFAYTLKKN